MNRKQFFASLKENVDATELRRIQAAYWIAKEAHRQQARDCGERYFEHPRRTASILIRHGVIDTHTILLALLHDTLEDRLVAHLHPDLLGGLEELRHQYEA